MKRRAAKRRKARQTVENTRQQPVQLPMGNKGEGNNQHRQGHCTAKQTTILQNVETANLERQKKPEESVGDKAKESERPKKFRTWMKDNLFNALLTIFTALYAFSFIFDSYITKRAYITRGTQDGETVSILPGDKGLKVSFRNTGQTPVKRHIIQAWLLKQGKVVPIDAVPEYIPERSIASGSPIRLYIQWPEASQEIPRIKQGEIGVGILGRITYQDAYYMWHCEEFAAHYRQAPLKAFVSTEGLRVCDSTIRSVRYNRVCVPSADKKEGSWIETWEAFSTTNDLSQSPTADPQPCKREGEAESEN